MKRYFLVFLCIVILAVPVCAGVSVSEDTVVYVTPFGEKYHKKSCSYVEEARKNGTREGITIKEAVERGLTPCSRCRPGKFWSKKYLVIVPKEPEISAQTPESVERTDYRVIGGLIGAIGVVILIAVVWTRKKRGVNMGVITYTKGNHPAFLTFRRHTSLLDTCVELGLITPDERQRCELFSPKIDKKISDVFTEYLANLETTKNEEYMRNFCNFFCSKEEARDNLCRLLDAAGHLYESSSILPSYFSTTFGFIPISENEIGVGYECGDIRYPFGKIYWFASIGVFNKITTQVLIDSEKVDFFCGNLHRFHIVFQDGMHIKFDRGKLIIRPQAHRGEIATEYMEIFGII